MSRHRYKRILVKIHSLLLVSKILVESAQQCNNQLVHSHRTRYRSNGTHSLPLSSQSHIPPSRAQTSSSHITTPPFQPQSNSRSTAPIPARHLSTTRSTPHGTYKHPSMPTICITLHLTRPLVSQSAWSSDTIPPNDGVIIYAMCVLVGPL